MWVRDSTPAGPAASSAAHHERLARHHACTDWQPVLTELDGLVLDAGKVLAVGAAEGRGRQQQQQQATSAAGNNSLHS